MRDDPRTRTYRCLIPCLTALLLAPGLSAAPSQSARVCWVRGEPLSVDWIAEQDQYFRTKVYSQRALERTRNGWIWERRPDAQDVVDMAPMDSTLPPARLEVSAGESSQQGEATFVLHGFEGVEYGSGTIEFRWTTPPERICSDETLDLLVEAEIVDGKPELQEMDIVLPLTRAQLGESGSDVVACTDGGGVKVAGIEGSIAAGAVLRAEGHCRRSLTHLVSRDSWNLRLNLPDGFSIIYPYIAR